MAGIGNNVTTMGDWIPPSPAQRKFFSNLMSKEFDPKSFSNGNEGAFLIKSNEDENVIDAKEEENVDLSTEINQVNSHKPSLTERRAARAGFNAPTINTDQIRAANFSSMTSEIRSPYLTIPPGLSPTRLLDSPVFLSNSLAQPSPTTGTFSFAQFNSSSFSVLADKSKELPEGTNSQLSPPPGSNPFYFSSGENQPASTIDPHHSSPCIPASLQNSKETNPSERELSTDDATPTKGKGCSPPSMNSPEEEKGEPSVSLSAPAEDGYNWRKYGQKHVKGSEYPRSYYKCTHANCPVKKKVERNHEGQVTEIIYKGAHNHPKPPPNRRSRIPSSHPFNEYQSDGQSWRNENGPEVAPSNEEAQDAVEVSSALSNEEDEEDRVTHGSVSLGCEGEGDESQSKRRKVEASVVEMSGGSRAVREPRVVVQTTSEVDILDDGYRWRKYGQKVVKGNPNPRSYYKCTNPGCSVRKHVERASHDLRSVITTYEGKHNHEVPAAKANNGGSTTSTLPSSVAPTASQPPPRGAQDIFPEYDVSAPFANFGFNVGPQGLAGPNLAMSRFGPMALPPVNAYMGQPGFVVPKEESMLDPSPNMSNGASAYYQQFMGRMPLGP